MNQIAAVCHARRQDPQKSKASTWLLVHANTMTSRRLPAEADMQRDFRVTPPTVQQMVHNVDRAQSIERSPGQSGSIQVLVNLDRVTFNTINQTLGSTIEKLAPSQQIRKGMDAADS